MPFARTVAKRVITPLCRRAGYAVLKESSIVSLPIAMHLERLFRRYSVETVFDVGANTGQFGNFLRSAVGFRGHIVSVEPIASHAAQLRHAASGDLLWHVHQMALGRRPGEQDINVTAAGVFSSFLPPDDSAVKIFREHNHVVRTERVEVQTLDMLFDWARANAVPLHNCYLKLDTQGYDLEVIAGAEASLQMVRALQAEMSVQAIYKGMPDHRSTQITLEGYGFCLSGMFPVTVDEERRLIEYDCVMVR